MPINETIRKPHVLIVARDHNGNDLSPSVEIECDSETDAILLWYKIREICRSFGNTEKD